MSSVKKFTRAGAQDGETDLAKTHYLLEAGFQLAVADSVVWYEQLEDLYSEGKEGRRSWTRPGGLGSRSTT